MMIEAVNSVLANASLVRGSTNQIDAAELPQIDAEGPSVPRAPFISPFISIDNNSGTAVLQIRDSETGDVLRQFPSETTIATRQRQEQLADLRDGNAAVSAQIQQSGGGVEFTAPQAPTAQPQAPAVDISAIQQATVALNTGASSGQIALSGNVNITA